MSTQQKSVVRVWFGVSAIIEHELVSKFDARRLAVSKQMIVGGVVAYVSKGANWSGSKRVTRDVMGWCDA